MDTDVAVVGAGPTGLLLAGDLATAGVRVIVLEKRPAGLSNLTRAFAVHARSLDVLDARGLAHVGVLEVLDSLRHPVDLVAGHSLGEYSALVAAGVIDFKDAVPLVRFRDQAMEEAGAGGQGGRAGDRGGDGRRGGLGGHGGTSSGSCVPLGGW